MCYVVRSKFQQNWSSQTNYCAHFHSIIKHGTILGDNALHIKKIFTLQKKFVRIIFDAKPKHLYRVLFRRVVILPCQCEYLHIFIDPVLYKLFLLISTVWPILISQKLSNLQNSKVATLWKEYRENQHKTL